MPIVQYRQETAWFQGQFFLQVSAYLPNHRRVFDAGDHFQRATGLTAGSDVDVKYPVNKVQQREDDVGRAILVRLFSAGSAVCHSASVKATFPTPPTVGRQHMAAHLPRLQSPANNHRNDKALICARPTRICYRPCGCATANRDRSAPRRAARGRRYCTNSASNLAPRCH